MKTGEKSENGSPAGNIITKHPSEIKNSYFI